MDKDIWKWHEIKERMNQPEIPVKTQLKILAELLPNTGKGANA